jgi:hypothetical protein
VHTISFRGETIVNGALISKYIYGFIDEVSSGELEIDSAPVKLLQYLKSKILQLPNTD